MAGGARPASARNVPDLGFNQARFIGAVAAIQGPADSPTRITLQLGALSTELRINLKTLFSAKGAEASLEGLLPGDFAVVAARRFKGAWIARRVLFDVQPIFPLRLFTGTVVRAGVDGKRVSVRIAATQRLLWFRISRNALYQEDGRAVLEPPGLTPGETVELLALRVVPGWMAYNINLKATAARQPLRAR